MEKRPVNRKRNILEGSVRVEKRGGGLGSWRMPIRKQPMC